MIDLHAHSTASDGTLTPAELMRAAAAAGLDVVALTDHDTTAGWAPAAAALPAGLTLVPGAELSCRWFGADPRIPLHLLGERYRVPKKDLDVFAALALVRGAGGVAVFAHPRATRRGRTVPAAVRAVAGGAGLRVDLRAVGEVGRAHGKEHHVEALHDLLAQRARFGSDVGRRRFRRHVAGQRVELAGDVFRLAVDVGPQLARRILDETDLLLVLGVREHRVRLVVLVG